MMTGAELAGGADIAGVTLVSESASNSWHSGSLSLTS